MAKAAFYGVQVGHVPGVYTTWDECKAQVEGYPGGKYKKFPTESQAKDFVFGDKQNVKTVVEQKSSDVQAESSASPASAKKASAFYAVRTGRVPGIYFTWDDCKNQIDGYPGAKYQKFKSITDAQSFMEGKDVPKPEKKTAQPAASVKLPDGPYAFVDGSFNAQTKVYGYGGFVCVDGHRYPIQGRGNDPEMASMRNVSGEIAGAMAAVKKAEELHLREITLLYDYKGIEGWAKERGVSGHWEATKQGTKEYAEFMKPENRLTHVVFQKVAAHTGIEGNEMADVMAKNAVGIALTPSQDKLLMRALNSNKRNGLEDVLSMPDTESEFSL